MFKKINLLKGMTYVLFLFVFTYLVIRTFFNAPILDEIATYFLYIYQGDYWGETMFWDANNHLLNSFIGHHLYPLFKDHINWYRIPHLISFILYFFGLRQILSELKSESLKLIALTTFCTIPFVIEYFAYCRGYGLSLGLFCWVLVHLKSYLKTEKSTYLFYAYIFLFLTISSNLTFINTAFLIISWVGFQLIINAKFLSLKELILKIGLTILFILSIIPFIKFSFDLKEHGALYYGGDAGLWDITGTTICSYIFFWCKDWLMYVFIAIFGLFTYSILKLKIYKSIVESFKNPFVLYFFLFFGNLVAVVLMAEILKVNYPQDRAGFYLVILFLILLFFYLDRIKWGNWIQYLFLFFPLFFLSKMSVETSVISPQDRLSKTFYSKVKKGISPEDNIMIHPLLNWNWMFYESLEKEKASVATSNNLNSTLTDIIITKKGEISNPEIKKNYKTFAFDPYSTYVALKHKVPLVKTKKYQSLPVSYPFSIKDFIPIMELDSLDQFIGKNIQVTVKGYFQTIDPKNKIQLIVHRTNKKNELVDYLTYSLEYNFQGKKINDSFIHHFVLENISSEDSKITALIWNRGLNKVQLKNASCILYEIGKR